MTTKTKQTLLMILIFALSIAGTIFFKRITIFQTDDALNPILGIMMGTILLALLTERMAVGWVYQCRYFLNGFGFGFGLIFAGSLDFFIRGGQPNLIKVLLFDGAFGLILGLISGLVMYLADLMRKRATPYNGTDLPIMTNNASLWYANHSFTKGRVILMSDRLLFLASGLPNQTIVFSDIIRIDFEPTLGFTNRLVFLMKDAESITISLPMAYYWKKKITEAMNFNLVKLG